ncbi:N-formylglutamate amidohydrolase [Actibacterium sp. 188UL27-1]|uniref:N-formylglutamate amidohydrolase n=1 Tax=Actibacterium sp. 188UL27-1 TaxID=2786961 RepID=UPI0019599F46|nr:N-formylglutamate amidohydrolase [Actibacterium sp. 188UL27-1]MBM7067026.1 N-formylglutamate amidohydrolase [Actibacterium sp. 188UL27-1]
MAKRSYRLLEPTVRLTSVVFSSPHSGQAYPWSFLRKTVLDDRAIRSSEDAFVDQLFDGAPALGAPLLAADVPRAFVDLNRSADELDPAVIDGVKGTTHNPRVSSGLGVIPRVVANGRAIYRGKLELAEAKARLADHWHPYHAALQAELDTAKDMFGAAVLIDCHSMPHEAIDAISGDTKTWPEVVLGDRFGAACAPDIISRIEAAFQRAGLRVARNAPFAGAYVTQAYGRPSRNQHAVQVEIDRSLYMDEATIQPNENFDTFKRQITQAVAEIIEIGRVAQPLAAE